MRIERLSASHIDGLERIENECFSEPWSRKALEDLILCDYAVYFVAVDDDGTVVGYCGMYVSFEVGSINNIGVLRSYRRQGVGALLLSHLCTYCESNGIALLTLEVRESNIPAISLYSRFGFEKVGERKNYYRKPTENGLLYNKKFEIKI